MRAARIPRHDWVTVSPRHPCLVYQKVWNFGLDFLFLDTIAGWVGEIWRPQSYRPNPRFYCNLLQKTPYTPAPLELLSFEQSSTTYPLTANQSDEENRGQ